MHGFCGSNVLYSASLSFRMFIFLLTPFDTWDCCYFGSNLSKKVVRIKKHVIFFWKWRNNFSAWVYFCVYPIFDWGDIAKRSVVKSGGFGKSNLLHTMIYHKNSIFRMKGILINKHFVNLKRNENIPISAGKSIMPSSSKSNRPKNIR